MITIKTDKKHEIIAYIALDSDMTSGGFQFELGKTYTSKDISKTYTCYFRGYLNLRDVYDYHNSNLRYFEAKFSGKMIRCPDETTSKFFAEEITILEEITDMVKLEKVTVEIPMLQQPK